MEIGLIGAPSSGKSTFFKASTLTDVKIASYPFTTIDPNVGMGYVTSHCPIDYEDKTNKCSPKHGMCLGGIRYIPIKVWDIAGLVPGAHEGKGLGNKFLDNLRQASVLIHVLDISGRTDSEGNETKDYDPSKTIDFLEKEIDSWYSDILKREWKGIKSVSKEDFLDAVLKRFSGLGIRIYHIRNALRKSGLEIEQAHLWSDDEIDKFSSFLRKSSKPMIIAANKIDLPESKENLKRIKEKYPEKIIIPCSGDSELALRSANDSKLIKYNPGSDEFELTGVLTQPQERALDKIKKNVLDEYGSTGVQAIMNKAVFEILDNIVVYPVEDENKLTDSKGNVLPDAIILNRGSTPKDLAFKVHSTMAKNFVTATNAKTKRNISSDYEIQNGDIIRIVFAK